MPEEREPRLLLILILGIIVGFLTAAGLCFLIEPIPADAQGVGFFGTSTTGTRTNCAALTGPIMGQTLCLEQSSNSIKVWDANIATWTEAGSGVGGFSLQNGVDYSANNFFNANATGTRAQAGILASISGTNVGGTVSRMAIGAHAYTGGGGSSTNQMSALNLVCQQNSGDAKTAIVCNEIDLNVNGTDDVLQDSSARAHYALSLVNAGGKIAGPAMLFISSSSGATNPYWRAIQIATSSVANGGYAFDYGGNGTRGATRITYDGTIQTATGISLNATQVIWNGSSPTNVPLCTNNCGNSPTVVGTNTAMRVTMGSTGTPRSPFLVLFNGTWNAAPACIAQLDTASTASVNVTNTTSTGFQVNTVQNPSQGSTYSVHCLGVQ